MLFFSSIYDDKSYQSMMTMTINDKDDNIMILRYTKEDWLIKIIFIVLMNNYLLL